MARRGSRPLAAALSALTVAVGASPVGAQHLSFPGQRSLHDARVQRLVAVAERYWHARGVHPCPHPLVRTAPSLEAVDGHEHEGYAQMHGCQVWLRSAFLRQSLSPHALDHGRLLCTIIVHELGHTAGLHHRRRGIMQPVVGTAQEPPECAAATAAGQVRTPLGSAGTGASGPRGWG